MTNQMQLWRQCLNDYYKTYRPKDKCYKIYQD